jgi:hypothetical protein
VGFGVSIDQKIDARTNEVSCFVCLRKNIEARRVHEFNVRTFVWLSFILTMAQTSLDSNKK